MTFDEKDFCDATAVWNCEDIDKFGDEISWACEPDDVVETRDTLENYFDARDAKPIEYQTPIGVLYVWTNIQTRKGRRRGDLFLMDGGEKRLSYFSGEP